MYRHCTRVLIALVALGLTVTVPSRADDSANIQREIDELKQELHELNRVDAAELETEIQKYLDSNQALEGSQGDSALSRIRINAGILAVNQNTLALDPSNRSLVNGRVELDTLFEVSESLSIFADLIAETQGTFPSGFPLDSGGFGPPSTFAGQDDGIGVNGSVSTRPKGGVQVREAGIRYLRQYANVTVGMELGLIDPRQRYLQNRYMQNFRTQFIYNQFDDETAIGWATTAAGTPILGAHIWLPFQDGKFTFRAGFYNNAGRWFDKGQLYLEFQWKGQVRGREMNVIVMYLRDAFTDKNAGGESDNGWGVSWDWEFSDRIGFFARIAGNTEDVSSAELSAGFGLVWTGVGSRADDQIGFAIGTIRANTTVLAVLDDTEWSFELYYKFMVEEGKFQITPNILYIADPGGGGLAWEDDVLWIFGVRIYVPF